MLIVLNDARDAAQVRPLLPASEGCAVLVTSRSTLYDLAGAVHFGLSVLTLDDGGQLFANIVGTARAAAEPEATREILRLCARLPLGTRIAAAKPVARPGWSVAEMTGRLAVEHRRLAELTIGDLAVRASFRLSYEGLAPETAHAFRLLGLSPPEHSAFRPPRRCSAWPRPTPNEYLTR